MYFCHMYRIPMNEIQMPLEGPLNSVTIYNNYYMGCGGGGQCLNLLLLFKRSFHNEKGWETFFLILI